MMNWKTFGKSCHHRVVWIIIELLFLKELFFEEHANRFAVRVETVLCNLHSMKKMAFFFELVACFGFSIGRQFIQSGLHKTQNTIQTFELSRWGLRAMLNAQTVNLWQVLEIFNFIMLPELVQDSYCKAFPAQIKPNIYGRNWWSESSEDY